MRILFDTHGCPLANNGGSSTIVKSANTLVDLGHEVTIIANAHNQHDWTPLKAHYKIFHDINKVPGADAVIATGFVTVPHVTRLPFECGKKFHWIRAWETWQIGDDQDIKKIVLDAPTVKLVNSVQLQRKLQSMGSDSIIVRPGYDYDLLYPTNQRDTNGNIIIGGLYRSGYHGKRKRTDWIFRTVSALRKKGYKISLWMFGSEIVETGNGIGIDKYILKPPPETKNFFFNKIDIWLAPTQSEGLHMPAAEAMLTGCPVVGTESPLSGMEDYLQHNKTGLVARNNIESFIQETQVLIDWKKHRLKLGKAGRDRILEMGDRKSNMQRLVEILGKQ